MAEVPRPGYPAAYTGPMLEREFRKAGLDPKLASQMARVFNTVLSKQAVDERLNYDYIGKHLGVGGAAAPIAHRQTLTGFPATFGGSSYEPVSCIPDGGTFHETGGVFNPDAAASGALLVPVSGLWHVDFSYSLFTPGIPGETRLHVMLVRPGYGTIRTLGRDYVPAVGAVSVNGYATLVQTSFDAYILAGDGIGGLVDTNDWPVGSSSGGGYPQDFVSMHYLGPMDKPGDYEPVIDM
jgi:hypothetical protein